MASDCNVWTSGLESKVDCEQQKIRHYQSSRSLTSSNSMDPLGLGSFLCGVGALSNGLITTDSKPLISPRQNGQSGGGLALF